MASAEIDPDEPEPLELLPVSREIGSLTAHVSRAELEQLDAHRVDLERAIVAALHVPEWATPPGLQLRTEIVGQLRADTSAFEFGMQRAQLAIQELGAAFARFGEAASRALLPLIEVRGPMRDLIWAMQTPGQRRRATKRYIRETIAARRLEAATR